MGMHATKDRVESDTSTVDSISLYESTITTRDEPRFGELKLALGVIGLQGAKRFPISFGAENESTSRCDTALSIFVGKERRSPSEPSNEEIRGEQSANGARSACGTGTETKIQNRSVEETGSTERIACYTRAKREERRYNDFLFHYFILSISLSLVRSYSSNGTQFIS
ncbi:hypothetical protein IEQ34_023475 [Dendrobium chrysotoxum]|uniref:Uncharacterized protein n=1 Tax=Dendrobium chrysotoxum TaxID=161865 RepID=A0AAV7FWC2_DENCH|nr:hypothetical protein IEQ34_023475 [Dendrobium chrysotoxum]